ncbi:SRPBCC family protein [Cellulosimicrobium terreum]|nr:SRPBCC family protein [Cellulosimicrobium terreum]
MTSPAETGPTGLTGPTGRVEVTGEARDLVLERTLAGSVDDVWTAVAEPAGLRGWYGVLDGEPRPGATVQLRMTAEEGEPVEEVNILACDPPRSYSVDHGGWRLGVTLTPVDDATTTLELRHRLVPTDDAGDIGPGWEYYLDLLDAARGGPPVPSFDPYLDALRGHYAD